MEECFSIKWWKNIALFLMKYFFFRFQFDIFIFSSFSSSNTPFHPCIILLLMIFGWRSAFTKPINAISSVPLYLVRQRRKAEARDTISNVTELFIITTKRWDRHQRVQFEDYIDMGLTSIRYRTLATPTDNLQLSGREKHFVSGHERVRSLNLHAYFCPFYLIFFKDIPYDFQNFYQNCKILQSCVQLE